MGEEDKSNETQSPAALEVDKKSVCYYVASSFVQYHLQLFVGTIAIRIFTIVVDQLPKDKQVNTR